MNVFEVIRQKSTPKLQKILYLVAASIATILGFILLFVPFFKYETTATVMGKPSQTQTTQNRLSAVSAISLLGNETNVAPVVSITAIVLFALWLAFIIASLILFARIPLKFSHGEQTLRKYTKTSLLLNTIATGVYFFSSFIFDLIFATTEIKLLSVFNAWPFIIALVLDAAFAFYMGVLHQEGEEVNKEPENLPKIKQLKLKTFELFGFTSAILVFAIIAFLTNIITIEHVNGSFTYTLSGLEILKNSSTSDAGGQVLAFVLFLVLTIVLSIYILSLFALLSKSKIFFSLSLTSIIVSCLCCFLIGMYGKYYEIVQAVNLQTVVNWLEQKYPNISTIISTDALKATLSSNYVISSSSFYFFLATFAIGCVLLVRKPYSKGLALVRELYPDKVQAKIEHSEIIIEGLDKKLDQSQEKEKKGKPQPKEEELLPQSVDPCPAFSELDGMTSDILSEFTTKKYKYPFEELTLPNLVRFIVQYARDSRLHLFYTEEDIATFIAGLGTTKLTILQGMSGTGKTSLPKIFSEALLSNCEIIEVESSWRDKNELLGYYNEFSKLYTPKKFTQALYKASLNPETLTFIVLDEMNLSRIEYYFSDFLSLMENEPDKREIKLLNVNLSKTEKGKKFEYKALTRGHTLKITPNVWFIGTANRDESTFEISDKVYDRAHTMNFNKRAKTVRHYNQPIPQRFITVSDFNALLENAKKTVLFNIDDYPLIAEVEKLLAPYNISFGNRIAKQIESFVSIYCACFTTTQEVMHDAVERILLSKVVSKLELKSIENKEELATAFEELGLTRCSEFISKLNED